MGAICNVFPTFCQVENTLPHQPHSMEASMSTSQIDPPPLYFPEGVWEQLTALLAKSKAKQPMQLEDEYDDHG